MKINAWRPAVAVPLAGAFVLLNLFNPQVARKAGPLVAADQGTVFDVDNDPAPIQSTENLRGQPGDVGGIVRLRNLIGAV